MAMTHPETPMTDPAVRPFRIHGPEDSTPSGRPAESGLWVSACTSAPESNSPDTTSRPTLPVVPVTRNLLCHQRSFRCGVKSSPAFLTDQPLLPRRSRSRISSMRRSASAFSTSS